MKVKALKMVYHGGVRYRPGTVFHLADEKRFSARSMEKVGAKDGHSDEQAEAPAPKKPGPKPKSKGHGYSAAVVQEPESALPSTGDQKVI